MYEVFCGMSLRCFDRLSNRKGARFSLLGQAKRAILPSTGSGTAWEGAQGPRRGLRDRGKGAQGPWEGGTGTVEGAGFVRWKKKRPGVLNLGPLMIITVLRVCLFPSASKDSGRADSQTWSCGRRPSTGTVAGAVVPDSRPYAR